MNLINGRRPTWVEVSLDSLTENYRNIKKRLTPGTALMAAVKANAYGHGAVECARALEAIDADWFGVAFIEEAIELRRAGISARILSLGGFWTGQAEEAIKHAVTTSIFRLDSVEELDARASENGLVAGFHLKVDTGMGRLGVPLGQLSEFIRELRRFRNVRIEGLMTHFSDADATDKSFTRSQILNFEQAVRVLREAGIEPQWRHLSGSAGIFSYEESHGNLARAGATLYGLTRDVLAPDADASGLRPVMSLYSKIILLKSVPPGMSLGYGRTFTTERESLIATIPIGYADGFRRGHSNKGRAIVRDRFAPVVGRVSMDLTMLDVTDIPDASLGDVVTLIGSSKTQQLKVEDLAEVTGTISYEIITGISTRVPRLYI